MCAVSAPGSDLSTARRPRFWEIDTLRGVAIIMMMMVHVRWDLVDMGGHGGPFLLAYGFWQGFARTTASIFMFLVGVSLTLSRARWLEREPDGRGLFRKILKRGLGIFGLGMVVTVVTGVLLGQGVVWFGILHFIGLSIILAYPFLRLRRANLVIGVLLIAAGEVLSRQRFGFSALMWLGFVPERLYSVDYYPLLPHFGVVLLGIFAGHMLYPGYARRFSLPDWSRLVPVRVLEFMGRHSLLIYLVHQPIFIALLGLTGVINLGF
jgi:uncharacterized membrane protein